MMFNDGREFEERADFIEDEDLLNWNVENAHFQGIQKKLLQKGAKLIVGPRGTGKTHQMKVAYRECVHVNSNPLAIYVSFGKYYYLEPFLYKSSNAIRIFHAWILSKIWLGTIEAAKAFSIPFGEIELLDEEKLTLFVASAEKGQLSPLEDELIRIISISQTLSIIDRLLSLSGRTRAILLLDDAALSLTPEYMIEFFDVFRSLKSIHVSPKASVYPGTTEYGPRFHIGQDAEKIDVWLNIEEDSYSSFMNSLIEKRLSQHISDIPDDVIEIFKYASFGIPRAFISLLRNYHSVEGRTNQSKFNTVLDDQAALLKKEYRSLHQKMPQYESIIDVGLTFFETIISLLKEENKSLLSENEKQIQIGIQREDGQQINRMVKFLIEAGLLFELGSVKHGPDRTYLRFIPHLIFLIKEYCCPGKAV